MNSVSWFLYIAQVGESLGSLLIVFGIIIAVFTVIGYAAPRIAADVNCQEYTGPGLRTGWLVVAAAVMILGTLVPSQNTMYAIAASEMGEAVAKSDAVQGIASDATKALQQWIKKQIEPHEKK